jgi:hypothetical protein
MSKATKGPPWKPDDSQNSFGTGDHRYTTESHGCDECDDHFGWWATRLLRMSDTGRSSGGVASVRPMS